MNFLPLPHVSDFREHVVVMESDDISITQLVVLEPSPADSQVSQIPIEHGHGGRHVLDEGLQAIEALIAKAKIIEGEWVDEKVGEPKVEKAEKPKKTAKAKTTTAAKTEKPKTPKKKAAKESK